MASDKELVEFALEDGSSVVFEADAGPGTYRASGGGDETNKAADKFDAVVKRIRPAAELVLDSLKELNTPSEIQLEFGIKFSAKTGVILASADSEVNFKVSIKWENPKAN